MHLYKLYFDKYHQTVEVFTTLHNAKIYYDGHGIISVKLLARHFAFGGNVVGLTDQCWSLTRPHHHTRDMIPAVSRMNRIIWWIVCHCISEFNFENILIIAMYVYWYKPTSFSHLNVYYQWGFATDEDSKRVARQTVNLWRLACFRATLCVSGSAGVAQLTTQNMVVDAAPLVFCTWSFAKRWTLNTF